MLAAPVRRGTLLVGTCVGGATIATCQGAVVLASAGLIGVPYRIELFAVLLAELLLATLAMTLMGVGDRGCGARWWPSAPASTRRASSPR